MNFPSVDGFIYPCLRHSASEKHSNKLFTIFHVKLELDSIFAGGPSARHTQFSSFINKCLLPFPLHEWSDSNNGPVKRAISRTTHPDLAPVEGHGQHTVRVQSPSHTYYSAGGFITGLKFSGTGHSDGWRGVAEGRPRILFPVIRRTIDVMFWLMLQATDAVKRRRGPVEGVRY